MKKLWFVVLWILTLIFMLWLSSTRVYTEPSLLPEENTRLKPIDVEVFEYSCRKRGVIVHLNSNKQVWLDHGNCRYNPNRMKGLHWATVTTAPHSAVVSDPIKTRGMGLFQ